MTLKEIIEKLQEAISSGVDGDLPVKKFLCGPAPVDFTVTVIDGVVIVERKRS